MLGIVLPTANQIRRKVLKMAFDGQSVHIPSAFSIVEILRVLHESILTYPNNDPKSKDRDFLVLSKGHGVMALYGLLDARGWIPSYSLAKYFTNGSLLPGLYEASIPGCEANTGSLGQGLGVAAGLALGANLSGSEQLVVCVAGDGEMNEGAALEALAFVGQRRLSNFALVVDLNGLQAMGRTDDIQSLQGLPLVLEGLGFEVKSVDGHSQSELHRALSDFKEGHHSKPLALLAKTIKGKGVSFMEDKNEWHYGRLDQATYEAALAELVG
jgi:transketolase